MKPSRSDYHIYEYRIFSVPLLGEWLYTLEHALFCAGAMHCVMVSRKDTLGRRAVIALLRRRARRIICYSVRLDAFLRECTGRQIILAGVPGAITHMSKARLRELMWTLVYADAVTHEVKQSLGSFLPASFPVWDMRSDA